MTKDELVAELRKQGYMRIADLLEAEGSCGFCTMPGGEHMRFCPNNPHPLDKQDVVGAKVENGEIVAVKKAKGK